MLSGVYYIGLDLRGIALGPGWEKKYTRFDSRVLVHLSYYLRSLSKDPYKGYWCQNCRSFHERRLSSQKIICRYRPDP